MKLGVKEWAILVGGSVGTYLTLKHLWTLTRKQLPQQSPTPQLPGAPTMKPTVIVGESIPFTPGRHYWATVDVGFPASITADPEAITKLAAERGFVNVSVSETRPPNWPGRSEGDYYISGQYRGAPSSISKEPGPGVEVKEAFILV